MLASTIIAKKRDREVLTSDEIRFMVRGLTDASIPNYQIAAWAMAIQCRGMTVAETAALTAAMLDSGERLRREGQRPRVDKHSTGGLGDKVSLILAPLLACFDVDVPMLSGRGLGITGGTLDKLEAFSGYRCDLSQPEINRQLESIGCVITGTTPEIAPADRELYRLRDVTATVPSIPLITSSIMSKKLAESLDALVLDVKVGSAAFMRTLPQARALARSLVATGKRMKVRTQAFISDMNQPLGCMVGNACEANEAIAVLRDEGPSEVRELTLSLAEQLLLSVGRFGKTPMARGELQQALADGRALSRFQRMVEAQGGQFADHLQLATPYVLEAAQSGWVEAIDGQGLGQTVIELGGGRQRLGDPVDPAVGLEMLVRVGSPITRGQPLLRFFARTRPAAEAARSSLQAALRLGKTPSVSLPLFYPFPPPAGAAAG